VAILLLSKYLGLQVCLGDFLRDQLHTSNICSLSSTTSYVTRFITLAQISQELSPHKLYFTWKMLFFTITSLFLKGSNFILQILIPYHELHLMSKGSSLLKQYFQIYLSLNLGFSLRNIITFLLFKVSTSNFKYIFLIITHMLCDKVHKTGLTISRIIPPWTWNLC
jgi:hypothetical protein